MLPELFLGVTQENSKKNRKCEWVYPSPSSVIAVSASTLSTSPTVVVSLQSMPSRQLSSEGSFSSLLTILETTTRYLVRPGCALSNFTACQQRKLHWVSATVGTCKCDAAWVWVCTKTERMCKLRHTTRRQKRCARAGQHRLEAQGTSSVGRAATFLRAHT